MNLMLFVFSSEKKSINYHRFYYMIKSSVFYILFFIFSSVLSIKKGVAQDYSNQNTKNDSINKVRKESQNQAKKSYPSILNATKNTMNVLCSSEMQGRGYVNKGEQLAANYIAEEFEKIGLLKYKSSYFQSFNLKSVNTFPKKIQLKSKNYTFQGGKNYLVASFSNSGRGKVGVLYLDSAFFESDSALLAFNKVSLKNSAIMYSDKWTKKIQVENPSFLEKIQEAKAVFIRTKKLIGVPSPIAYSKPYFEVLDSIFPVYEPLDLVDLADLKLAKKTNKIKTLKFKVKSELVELQPSQNVIGYIKGTVTPEKVIVFSAHYDHLGKMGKDVYFAGANDNASGVAMLLELAKYYAENPPEYSIAFMAFGSEEIGILGSMFYTKNPLFPLKNIQFLINLDLVGTGEKGATVVNATIHEREFALLKKINTEQNYLKTIESRGEAANSDHYFFHKNRVPSFFIYLNGGSQAYHDINDTPENVSLFAYQNLYELLIEFVGQLSINSNQ
ncbi:M28 family metallopeptidase [Bernardetia sp. OM2101]|uniref:M28 family metallopeptidase n=1 Tax=Bernardetia sp. OM2101 TaxID=3344876 RepID=UPI0035CF1926